MADLAALNALVKEMRCACEGGENNHIKHFVSATPPKYKPQNLNMAELIETIGGASHIPTAEVAEEGRRINWVAAESME